MLATKLDLCRNYLYADKMVTSLLLQVAIQAPISPLAREEGFKPELPHERFLDDHRAVVELEPGSEAETFRTSVENFRPVDRNRTPIRFDTHRLPKSGKNIAFRPL